MNCLKCGFRNPATVAYCQKCGQRLDLTADEIQASMVERVKGEKAAGLEDNMRQMSYLAAVVFLIALTLYLAVGAVPSGRKSVPSAAEGADYVKFVWRFEPKMDKALVPYEGKRTR